MQDSINNPARAMSFYKRLRVFDPRNIRDMDAPWASVLDLLGAAPSPDDDDDLKDRKQQLNALLGGAGTHSWRDMQCSTTTTLMPFGKLVDP